MRIKPLITLIFLVALTYLWLGYSMIVLRSPMLTMVVYYPVMCFGGGFFLQRLSAISSTSFLKYKSNSNPLLLTFIYSILATTVLWASTLLFRPGIIDPEIITGGLDSIGMTHQRYWIAAGFLALVNPFAEEFLWRGSVFTFLLTRMNRVWAVVVSSLLFAGYHPLVISMIFPAVWLVGVFLITFVGGIFLSELYLRTRSLGYPIALHVIINANLMVIGFLYAPLLN